MNDVLWDMFCKSGKVEDYLRYSQMKSQNDRQEQGNQEVQYAAEDLGFSYQGTDDWRE